MLGRSVFASSRGKEVHSRSIFTVASPAFITHVARYREQDVATRAFVPRASLIPRSIRHLIVNCYKVFI